MNNREGMMQCQFPPPKESWAKALIPQLPRHLRLTMLYGVHWRHPGPHRGVGHTLTWSPQRMSLRYWAKPPT
ncbi:unnamed protein product [Pieris macdunnoughi]|uniref:Uncharacterized protein n=1 Tax=Pieris macdunnoughi TaxID=345717 RepID=A0A821UTX4_9NEOP|nr:unnamed protein product [Pieris macdunnoughi]